MTPDTGVYDTSAVCHTCSWCRGRGHCRPCRAPWDVQTKQTEQADTGGGRLCGGKRMRAPVISSGSHDWLVCVCVYNSLAGRELNPIDGGPDGVKMVSLGEE